MFIALIDLILRNFRRSVVIAIVVMVFLIGLLWWDFIWQSPGRVFNDMLANNLSTTSVTKHINVSSSSENIDQSIRLDMGSTNATDWLVTATQSNTAVTSESIGTSTTGYIRYTQITNHPRTQQMATNLGKVLNVWGKVDGKTDTSLNQLFDQTLLDTNYAPLLPIGNVSINERQALVSYMQYQGVLSNILSKVSTQTISGRSVYTYHVLVHLGPYVRLMQSFAHALGISYLNGINPDQYSNVAPVSLTLSVDKISHQLLEVVFPASGFAQSYTDWGILTPMSVPKTTISTTALQDRLNALK